MARALGARALMAPSAGNAAGALAAYGAAARLPVVVAMPDDTPRAFVDECRHYGAEVKLVPGTIADAGKWLREHGPEDAFDVSTLREPYRVEGKKTMAYELYEQFDGALPDVIVYPTGGGTGPRRHVEGVRRDARARLADGARRRGSCQRAGRGLRAGGARASSKARRNGAVCRTRRRARGACACRRRSAAFCACARCARRTARPSPSTSRRSRRRRAWLAAASGVDVCPEGGAAWAAVEELRASGWIAPDARVVVFNTGTGLKYR